MTLNRSWHVRQPRKPRAIWQGLASFLALLCVSRTALDHDIYSRLRDKNGNLCCSGQDCKPVDAVALPDGAYYLPETDETIAADIAAPPPDNRFHHCTYYPVAN